MSGPQQMRNDSGVRKVLVTAGASGIGLAITEAFAAQGDRVHVADIDAAAVHAVTDRLGNVTGSVADVSDPVAVARLFDDVSEQLGGLDVLVNNAGVAGPTAPVHEISFQAWKSVVAVNLDGTFLVTQHAVPLLKQSDAGTIIIMSSLAGLYGYPNRIAYSSTKWALVGFAKTLALELGSHGITANTIHPGAVAGARMEAVLRGRAETAGTSVEDERTKAMANQAVSRFVQPSEIAALALFLAGPTSRSITGQTFPIDGGSKAAQ
jgi:NAD(P)-dependent dehydrogenase (short-subunit alcohol dehydrogenase family)